MTVRPSDLPDFSDPPVVETVLSVQFEALSEVRTAHFGLYWTEIHERFPETEERGELTSIIEQFPDLPKSGIGIYMEALEVPPMPRFWFVNRSGTELIQVQRDRFIKNWRKVGEGDQYPKYERVKEGFERDFRSFREFVTKQQLGTVRVNQCEVTYVNQILAGEGWSSHAEIDKVFTLWRQPASVCPGRAEDISFHARFPITDKEGAPVGRLHAMVQSAARVSDGNLMFVLNLTARGQVGEGTDFFDLGRSWIVRSFKELTTPEMHMIWGIRS